MRSVLRVVFDPNVLISGAISKQGAPAALIDLIDVQIVVPIVCPTLVSELRDVLRRPKLRRYIDADQAARYVAEIVQRSEMHDDPGHVEAVSPDVDDDYLIALARLTAADGLVSGDQDLTRLTLGDVTIWTPRELLDELTDALEGELDG